MSCFWYTYISCFSRPSTCPPSSLHASFGSFQTLSLPILHIHIPILPHYDIPAASHNYLMLSWIVVPVVPRTGFCMKPLLELGKICMVQMCQAPCKQPLRGSYHKFKLTRTSRQSSLKEWRGAV